MRVFVCVCVCQHSSPGNDRAFTTVFVVFPEAMTSFKKWIAFQKRPIIVWGFLLVQNSFKNTNECHASLRVPLCSAETFSEDVEPVPVPLVWMEHRRVIWVCGSGPKLVLHQEFTRTKACYCFRQSSPITIEQL